MPIKRPTCVEVGCTKPAELSFSGRAYKKRCADCQASFDQRMLNQRKAALRAERKNAKAQDKPDTSGKPGNPLSS